MTEPSKPVTWEFGPVHDAGPPQLDAYPPDRARKELNRRAPASKVYVRGDLTFDEKKVWVCCRGCGVPLTVYERVYCRECKNGNRR